MNLSVDKEESPSRNWSPHTAALHRRRKFDQNTDKSKLKDVLGGLDLGDDDDVPIRPKSDSKLRSSRSKSPGKKVGTARTTRSKSPGGLKSRSRAGNSASSRLTVDEKPNTTELTQADIPLETLRKLCMITDPNAPLKEKVQMEVDMMRDPVEKRILVEFRHKFDRKAFLSTHAEQQRAEDARIRSNIQTEEQIEAEFKAQVAKKRQMEVEEEIRKAEREAKAVEDARKHALETVAKDMEGVRQQAEKTVAVASVSRLKKQKEQEELERQLKEFREGEGKNMHWAQRELKEARIQQKFVDREKEP
jgi:hypothetical protein